MEDHRRGEASGGSWALAGRRRSLGMRPSVEISGNNYSLGTFNDRIDIG